MSDIEYSPDGQFLWTGAKWVAVNSENQTRGDSASSNKADEFWARGSTNSRTNDEAYSKIENLARVMIDKLSRNDLISAKECWTQAKMVDLTITELVFEQQYGKEISDAYLSIAEYELDKFEVLYNNPHTVDIAFKVKVEMATNPIEMALSNSSTFLSQHVSFRYNILYAKMWLFCRRFNLVWNREKCHAQYELYLGVAQRLASNATEMDACRNIEHRFDEQMNVIRNENTTLLISGIFLILASIVLFFILID